MYIIIKLIIAKIAFQALLANEKLPNLEGAQVGPAKYTQYNVLQKLKNRDRDRDFRRQVTNIFNEEIISF